GVAGRIENEIADWIGKSDRDLDSERRKLEAGHSRASRQNWLYYGARQVFDVHPERERLRKWRAELEAANGVRHIPAVGTGVDSAAQVFMLSKLDASAIDPRLGAVDARKLRESDASIVHVDYRLGGAANQRAVTVRGTFLQNLDYLDFYYQGRYTVVEMEAGPYLDACYEIGQPERYPVAESVNMAQLSFDLGIVHYASDTPYTQARTLGARGLSYRGMDSTYASAIAVARRILQREEALLPQK